MLGGATLIVFLNKCDLLEKKLKEGGSLKKWLPSFGDRGNDVASFVKCEWVGGEFFPHFFLVPPSRPCYPPSLMSSFFHALDADIVCVSRFKTKVQRDFTSNLAHTEVIIYIRYLRHCTSSLLMCPSTSRFFHYSPAPAFRFAFLPISRLDHFRSSLICRTRTRRL
jgi:hypothetical protein